MRSDRSLQRKGPRARFRRLSLSALLIASSLSLLACGGAQSKPTPAKAPPVVQKPKEPKLIPKKPQAPPPEVVLKRSKEETSRSIEAALNKAMKGDNAGALAALEDVLAKDNAAFLAAYNIGIFRDQANEVDAARRSYERSLEIEPAFSPALLNLVRLRLREGDQQAALSLADRYLTDQPENVGHHLARLEVILAMEKPRELIEAARRVLTIDEANARARYYLAYAHYQLGRYPLAEYIVLGALEVDAMDPEGYFLKGLVLTKLDKPLDATKAFEQAVALRRDYPEALNALALSRYKAREFDEAENYLLAALKQMPHMKEAHLNLGNVYKAKGLGDNAEASYKTAIELDPQWPDAHFALGSLFLAVDVIKLATFQTTNSAKLERLSTARAKIEEAGRLWGEDREGQALTKQFVAKVEKNVALVEESMAFEGDGGGFGEDGDGGGFDDDDSGGGFDDDSGGGFDDDSGGGFDDDDKGGGDTPEVKNDGEGTPEVESDDDFDDDFDDGDDFDDEPAPPTPAAPIEDDSFEDDDK